MNIEISQQKKEELLDRAYCLSYMFGDLILDHEASDLLRTETDILYEAICKYHNSVGVLTWGGMKNE